MNEDIVVPRSRLEDLFEFTARLQKKSGLPIACFGHAGDGNIHVNVMYDANWPEVENAHRAALDELFRQVLAWDGVITGEHGIGLAKKRWWPLAVSPAVRNAARENQTKPGSKRDFESRQIRLKQGNRPQQRGRRNSTNQNWPIRDSRHGVLRRHALPPPPPR